MTVFKTGIKNFPNSKVLHSACLEAKCWDPLRGMEIDSAITFSKTLSVHDDPFKWKFCLLRRSETAFSGVPTEMCLYIFDILLAVEFFFFTFRGWMGLMLCHICQFESHPSILSEEQSLMWLSPHFCQSNINQVVIFLLLSTAKFKVGAYTAFFLQPHRHHFIKQMLTVTGFLTHVRRSRITS